MTKQQEAEGIAEFLGVTVDTMSGVLHLGDEPLRTPHSAGYVYRRNPEEFINWLNSDGGTVSMIEKFREKIEPPLSTNLYMYELESAVSWTKMTLNAALQTAILEVIKDG